MKKTASLYFVLLLLSSFITISVIPSNDGIKTVYADDSASIVFCPNNVAGANDTVLEITTSTGTCNYIDDFFGDLYPSHSFIKINGTVSDYSNWIWTINVCWDHGIVFSKGHRGVPFLYSNPPNGMHVSLIDHDGYDTIDNDDIYAYSSQVFYFVFLWHCETAKWYETGEIPWEEDYGYYGMPYCWTHNEDLEKYDYPEDNGDQVFLGWAGKNEGWSPDFSYEIPDQYPDQNWWYCHFAYLFFEIMCDEEGFTVWDALDGVSNEIYSDTFDNSPLWNWLFFYGNGDLSLPEE